MQHYGEKSGVSDKEVPISEVRNLKPEPLNPEPGSLASLHTTKDSMHSPP